MPEKIKYTINKKSKAPFVSSMFSLLAVVMLCVMYWPIFVQYFAGNVYDGPEVTTIVMVTYSILIVGLLLYTIFTGAVAKKSLAPSAIFAVFPTLFYLLDVSGLRNVILFFDPDNTFAYYRSNIDYFEAAWPFIIALSVITILSTIGYFMLSLSKHRGFALTFITINTLSWFAFSAYYVIFFAIPEFNAKLVSTRDFVYIILSYTAVVFYFLSQLIVAAAQKKAAASMPAEVQAYAVPPVPLPLTENDPGAVIDIILPTENSYSHDAAALPDHLAESTPEAEPVVIPNSETDLMPEPQDNEPAPTSAAELTAADTAALEAAASEKPAPKKKAPAKKTQKTAAKEKPAAAPKSKPAAKKPKTKTGAPKSADKKEKEQTEAKDTEPVK